MMYLLLLLLLLVVKRQKAFRLWSHPKSTHHSEGTPATTPRVTAFRMLNRMMFLYFACESWENHLSAPHAGKIESVCLMSGLKPDLVLLLVTVRPTVLSHLVLEVEVCRCCSGLDTVPRWSRRSRCRAERWFASHRRAASINARTLKHVMWYLFCKKCVRATIEQEERRIITQLSNVAEVGSTYVAILEKSSE